MTELKKEDDETVFHFASRIFGAVVETFSSQSTTELVRLAATTNVSTTTVSKVWGSWKQAIIGDRPPKRPMPSFLNPKRTLEKEWESLCGTPKEKAKEAFMEQVTEFAKDKEDLVAKMCERGKIDLAKVRADLESKKSATSGEEGKASEAETAKEKAAA